MGVVVPQTNGTTVEQLYLPLGILAKDAPNWHCDKWYWVSHTIMYHFENQGL